MTPQMKIQVEPIPIRIASAYGPRISYSDMAYLPPALGSQQSIGLLRAGRLELWIVQCLASRGRDRQRLPGERVGKGGQRQDVIRQRPAIRIREGVVEGRHRCSA